MDPIKNATRAETQIIRAIELLKADERTQTSFAETTHALRMALNVLDRERNDYRKEEYDSD